MLKYSFIDRSNGVLFKYFYRQKQEVLFKYNSRNHMTNPDFVSQTDTYTAKPTT